MNTINSINSIMVDQIHATIGKDKIRVFAGWRAELRINVPNRKITGSSVCACEPVNNELSSRILFLLFGDRYQSSCLLEVKMKIRIFVIVLLAWSSSAWADDSNFSDHLFSKFQTKGCTTCHDFFEKERGGISFSSHKGRTSDMCVLCHTKEITGFKPADEWFAQPGLYTSGMNSQQTCEATKTALHAKFKNIEMVARLLEVHLFEDPRVLWGIEGATAQSGTLPSGGKEINLVKEGLPKWKDQVRAWIQGGMKCK